MLEKCPNIEPEEYYQYEQMIPTKSKSALKQYRYAQRSTQVITKAMKFSLGVDHLELFMTLKSTPANPR